MIFLILVIIAFIVGIILTITGFNNSIFDTDWELVGVPLAAISGVILLIMIIGLLTKPVEYRKFKVKYDTVKETITYKDDIRDATYTSKIIEINEEINKCRELIKSKWIGIFQNKKICELELIKKY